MITIANTKPKLAIFEPITLPSAISACPLSAAFKLTINSGMDVAKETTVIPMTIFGIFMIRDKETAAFSNQLPPRMSMTNPSNINK